MMRVQSRFDSKKIGELVCDGALKYVQNFAVEIDGDRVAEYESLDKVASEWKDYVPQEPLIKDKKVRKAVRAWAEANDIDRASYYKSSHYWYLRAFYDHEQAIDFWLGCNTEPEAIEAKSYTIEELCGDEE